MARKTRVRDQDKFMLRLPDGMRDRIKAKAERAGMSMNEAIVWCLEQHFPAPATLEDRIEGLAMMVAALKHGNDLEPAIDGIVDEIDDILKKVADGKVAASSDFKSKVKRLIADWDLEEYERSRDNQDPFDDENYPSGGDPFKELPD